MCKTVDKNCVLCYIYKAIMLAWWNGRRVGLKIRCWWQHVGSSPTASTKKKVWYMLCQTFFRRTFPKRIFTFCKVQYIFTHKWKCCRNDTFFTYCVTLRWSVEIATTSISKIRPLFTADFFCGNCISDIKTDNYKIIVGNWYCLQTKRHPIVQRIFAKLESNTTQLKKRITNALINCRTQIWHLLQTAQIFTLHGKR